MIWGGRQGDQGIEEDSDRQQAINLIIYNLEFITKPCYNIGYAGWEKERL